MKQRAWCIAILTVSWFPAVSPLAQTPVVPAPLPVPRDTFYVWMARLSNAGRWGADDELGTLNLITPAKRRAAAQSVRDGITVSMEREVVAGPDSAALFPFRLRAYTRRFDSTVTAAADSLWVIAHGVQRTHLDALSHVAYRDRFYNDVPLEQLSPVGARRLGLQAMQRGIITRGVLVDLPRLRNVEFLPPGTAVTAADLQQWERQHRVRVEAGDVLLIRVGGRAPDAAAGASAPGLHPSLALWLRERGVAALGCNCWNEAEPSVVSGLSIPLHALAVAAMGMPLLDNLDLEEVAREAAARRRPTFLFVAAPPRIRGATSTLINPLAVF